MNLAEKLASTYLRLNGFFLLPHFTVFDGVQHNHIDILGLRAPNSIERIKDICLPTDDKLFEALSHLSKAKAREIPIGVAAEVRTNADRTFPNNNHILYAENFLGGHTPYRLAFSDGKHSVKINDDVIDIGVRYSGIWIQRRIDEMRAQKHRLSKVGSWNWSESFLADFLALRSCGLLTEKRK